MKWFDISWHLSFIHFKLACINYPKAKDLLPQKELVILYENEELTISLFVSEMYPLNVFWYSAERKKLKSSQNKFQCFISNKNK